MFGEPDGIVEGVPSRSGHWKSTGSRLQHAALDRTESRRRLGAVVDVAAEPVLTVMHRAKVFHGGVTRVHHHGVAVVRVQARVHQSGRLCGGVLGGAIVRVGSGRIHLRPVRVGTGGRWQTVNRLRSGGASVASAADDVSSVASLASVTGGHPSAGREKSARSLFRPVAVLLHVLGQVGLLRVALSAELADVSLQVLRLLVLGNVIEESVLVDEALVAGVALVGFVGLVASGVGLQVGELREGLGAAVVATLVRLVARVCADVLLQVRQLRELSLADFASEQTKKKIVCYHCVLG